MRRKEGGLTMKKNSSKGYVILGILFALVSVIAFAEQVFALTDTQRLLTKTVRDHAGGD